MIIIYDYYDYDYYDYDYYYEGWRAENANDTIAPNEWL